MNEKELLVDAFKSTIDQIAKNNAISVWIPSKGAFFKFKQLTFNQYNQFLTLQSQELDEVTSTYKFLEILNQVIADNILDTINIFSEFTVIDRSAIAIQLRAAINDKFVTFYNEKPIDVSLKTHVSSLTSIGNPLFERNLVITFNSMNLTLDIPSIDIDQRVNQEILKYNQESEEFTSLLLFVEMAKFLKSIQIDKLSHSLKENVEESIQIFKYLPISIMEKLATYIESAQNIIEKVMNVEVNIPETDTNSETPKNPSAKITSLVKIPILLDVNWFTNI